MGNTAGMLLTGLMVVSGAFSALAAVEDKGAGSGTSAKAPRERSAQSYLQRLDVDNDGAVTIEEYLRRRTMSFTRLDRNRDGVVEQTELTSGSSGRRGLTMERRIERLFERAGTNALPKLTLAAFESELTATEGKRAARPPSARMIDQRQRLFAFYDQNADGVVEKAEFDAARAEDREYRQRRAMHILDRSGDGKITLEEFTADARARFQRLDLNRDGRINEADMPPMVRQQWSQR